MWLGEARAPRCGSPPGLRGGAAAWGGTWGGQGAACLTPSLLQALSANTILPPGAPRARGTCPQQRLELQEPLCSTLPRALLWKGASGARLLVFLFFFFHSHPPWAPCSCFWRRWWQLVGFASTRRCPCPELEQHVCSKCKQREVRKGLSLPTCGGCWVRDAGHPVLSPGSAQQLSITLKLVLCWRCVFSWDARAEPGSWWQCSFPGR